MQQPRILARGEALLREPASGSTNLIANPGTWYVLAPRHRDERFEISSVALSLAGAGMLSHLDSFGGSAATLEVSILGYDGYGSQRDLASLVPQVLNSADDWNGGTHAQTFADAEAGQVRDGSDRVGLRGLPVRTTAPPAQQPQWRSAVLPLRYGATISAVSWDCWTPRDPSGQTAAPPAIEMRTGTRSALGVIAWGNFQPIASTPQEIDQGFSDLVAPAAGDVFQFRVSLPYADTGAAPTPSDSVLQTATVFALCVWVNLQYSRWSFTSLAEVLERSELARHVASGSWGSGDDVALLRIPLNFALRSRFGESIRARISGAAGLSLVEIVPQVDLRFETLPHP